MTNEELVEQVAQRIAEDRSWGKVNRDYEFTPCYLSHAILNIVADAVGLPSEEEMVTLMMVCDYFYDSNLDREVGNYGLNDVHDDLFNTYWKIRKAMLILRGQRA